MTGGDDVIPVLVDDGITDEFAPAVDRLGERFEAPSGRRYSLERTGSRLVVRLELAEIRGLPSEEAVDADLLELACTLYDMIGGEWSGDVLRMVARTWAPAVGTDPGPSVRHPPPPVAGRTKDRP
jgi:hypothetical protein